MGFCSAREEPAVAAGAIEARTPISRWPTCWIIPIAVRSEETHKCRIVRLPPAVKLLSIGYNEQFGRYSSVEFTYTIKAG